VTTKKEIHLKVLLWGLVAVYTFMLPDAIIIYRNIVAFFGQSAAGNVPMLLVLAAAIIYGIAILLAHRNWKNLLYLIPCALIAYLIMTQVSNPNKHIHIPEYVVMTWLLYAALSKDYRGKGIFILVFIMASMLGVVDEIEQGIHPARFYGLSDMAVNCASALIGVFTLMGLKKASAGNWGWTKRLQDFKPLLWLIFFGIASGVTTCTTLFQVQAAGDFWIAYPKWLFAWNILFLAATPLVIFLRQKRIKKDFSLNKSRNAEPSPIEAATAGLWVYPILAILFYINALVIYITIAGTAFN
jgi:hypothetical protein